MSFCQPDSKINLQLRHFKVLLDWKFFNWWQFFAPFSRSSQWMTLISFGNYVTSSFLIRVGQLPNSQPLSKPFTNWHNTARRKKIILSWKKFSRKLFHENRIMFGQILWGSDCINEQHETSILPSKLPRSRPFFHL